MFAKLNVKTTSSTADCVPQRSRNRPNRKFRINMETIITVHLYPVTLCQHGILRYSKH